MIITHETPPRSTEWIEMNAQFLQNAVNTEIRERAQYHSRLTMDAMVEEVVSKHLNGLWEYMRLDHVGDPVARIQISRYLGPVLEPGVSRIKCSHCGKPSVLTKDKGQYKCLTCGYVTHKEEQ